MKNPNFKAVLFIAAFLLIAIVFSLIDAYHSEKQRYQALSTLGDLAFSGKVVNDQVYNYGGRPYRLVCLKLNRCNQSNIYRFNDFCTLKIKDSIATMSVGGTGHISPVVAVEVDARKDIMIWRYQNATADTGKVDFRRNGLTEGQMNFCH